MTGPGGLDVRVPIGAMFTIVGALLLVYGAVTFGDTIVYARSLFIDVNLWWGGVLLAFGLVLLALARRKGT